jgi:hypothetical protein
MPLVLWRWLGSLGLALLLPMAAAVAVTFDPAALPASFQFRIANKHSGLCWDVPNGKPEPGLGVQQYPCHSGTAQTWTVEQRADTQNRAYLLIHSVADPAYCVAKSAQGQLILDLCSAPQVSDRIEWRMDRRTPNGFYVPFINPLRSAGCIDVPSGSVANATILQVYGNCHLGPNQAWVLLPLN